MQGILLYGLETWVLLASMSIRIEGTQKGFLLMITSKRENQLEDGTWETLEAEGIREVAGTQSARIYI